MKLCSMLYNILLLSLRENNHQATYSRISRMALFLFYRGYSPISVTCGAVSSPGTSLQKQVYPRATRIRLMEYSNYRIGNPSNEGEFQTRVLNCNSAPKLCSYITYIGSKRDESTKENSWQKKTT